MSLGGVQEWGWRYAQMIGDCVGMGQINVISDCVQERLLLMLLFQNLKYQKLVKFLRDMVRVQVELCQLRVYREELEDFKLREVVLWVFYRRVVWYGMVIIKVFSVLQNLLLFFRISLENWLVVIKQVLNSMKQREIYQREDLFSYLLQLRIQLIR